MRVVSAWLRESVRSSFGYADVARANVLVSTVPRVAAVDVHDHATFPGDLDGQPCRTNLVAHADEKLLDRPVGEGTVSQQRCQIGDELIDGILRVAGVQDRSPGSSNSSNSSGWRTPQHPLATAPGRRRRRRQRHEKYASRKLAGGRGAIRHSATVPARCTPRHVQQDHPRSGRLSCDAVDCSPCVHRSAVAMSIPPCDPRPEDGGVRRPVAASPNE